MADQKKSVISTAGPWGRELEHLNLWEVEELCRIARAEGLPDESDVRVEYDPNFHQTRYVVVHDPSMRKVGKVVDHLPPCGPVLEIGGDRLVEIGFESTSDVRAPRRVRLMIQDAATSQIISLIRLDEHEFVGLLSGMMTKVRSEI